MTKSTVKGFNTLRVAIDIKDISKETKFTVKVFTISKTVNGMKDSA